MRTRADEDVDDVEKGGEHRGIAFEVSGRASACSAARAIAPNEPASKLAPPTSAPSTFGQASSAAALSGFTEPAVEDARAAGASSAVSLAEPPADGRVDLLGLGGAGVLAGADGPHRLVGDGDRRRCALGEERRGTRVDLARARRRACRPPRARASVSPTHTMGISSAAKRGGHLLGDHRVGLAEELPPLAVADDDPGAARVLEHRRADLAGEGPRVLRRARSAPRSRRGSRRTRARTPRAR